ncbi:anthranilate phosphoribosyltransferase [bacterium F11]|nr:anthranilate phosphoribosyltransferase [bacterium F11]
MIRNIIAKLIEEKNLTKSETQEVMTNIMSGKVTPSQIAGFLVALRTKGETVDEIAGCALAMRDAANSPVVKTDELVDNCGTGGDGKQSLNISTAAAFVVAGAGFAVAKHGNRSISSRCGSADVLEAMGVKVDCVISAVESCINEAGIGFMFAPNFHPAMKHAMPTRKELGIRTVFNILGPLSNPAKAKVQLIGVFEKGLTKVIANVLSKMDQKAGMVVHSNGWDEITLDGPTWVSELKNKKVTSYQLKPKDFGLPKVSSSKLKGSDARENSEMILNILDGKDHPAKHVIVANAAALIKMAEGSYRNRSITLKEAVKRAEESLASKEAMRRYKKMAELSHMMS